MSKEIDQNAAHRLKKALGYVERGWVKKAEARDKDGLWVDGNDPSATCWCAVGAMKAAGCTARDFERVSFCLGGPSKYGFVQDPIISFNDAPGRTKREVVSLFRVAIRKFDHSLPARSAA